MAYKAYKRSITGLESTTGVIKKPRYQAPINTARTRQMKRWDVGEKLSVSVFYWNDTPMVDIINNDKMHAALALTTDQFRTMKAVKEAMTKGNFEYDIGSDVLLKREVFKSKWYVSVRQQFKDDQGLIRPGKQGSNMAEDVWDGFVSIMDEIGEFRFYFILLFFILLSLFYMCICMVSYNF